MKSVVDCCKRGRPREFDEGVALDAALAIFWKNGFEGTSLSDLTAAMGINRPSLYAAFGNKESLFRRVMDRYSQRSKALVERCAAQTSAREFVQCLMRGAVDGHGNRGGQAGCFLVQGAMTCSETSAAVRRDVSARRLSMGTILQDRFDLALKDGELPIGTSTRDLAGFFTAVMHGMAVRAGDGADRATLHGVVDIAMRAWPGATPSAKDASSKPESRVRIRNARNAPAVKSISRKG